jgi:hypothetical protein
MSKGSMKKSNAGPATSSARPRATSPWSKKTCAIGIKDKFLA